MFRKPFCSEPASSSRGNCWMPIFSDFLVNATPPGGLDLRRRARPSSDVPPRNQMRGAERREAHLGIDRTLRAVRPWRRALAFRRSTCGVLVSTAGRAFAGYTGRQPAPGRRLIVASRAEPRRRPSAWLRTTPAGAAPNNIGNYPVPSTRGFAGPHLRSQTSDLLRLQDRL